jgi:hypothetical protein
VVLGAYGEVGDKASTMGEYRWAAEEGSDGECRFAGRPPER